MFHLSILSTRGDNNRSVGVMILVWNTCQRLKFFSKKVNTIGRVKYPFNLMVVFFFAPYLDPCRASDSWIVLIRTALKYSRTWILYQSGWERKREIRFKAWVHRMVGPANLNFVRWATGRTLRQDFCITFWRRNCFCKKPQPLLLRPSTDSTRPIHTIKGDLLYLKATDCKC